MKNTKLLAAIAASAAVALGGLAVWQTSYAGNPPPVKLNHQSLPLFNNPPAASPQAAPVGGPNFSSIVKR
ncbi:MAG: peptidase, partial [Betaproteobacteria bacterium]|nr:peptidase [Betaproteobacteria bacterium]